ncbi:hypothetical protein LX16_3654 [Stackebrandtia albiflava]|uniref:Uncharacterized protein n=1 Tax=Stackebrandtia albiflava TaxID=406432 RepID=A0A562V4Z8_9ACTN|nr:hypothetical protein [Stackebrandtia albiflava]TWJ12887.1 hypothetical protein LX16_3654 [Stackebrandtia albiflava]
MSHPPPQPGPPAYPPPPPSGGGTLGDLGLVPRPDVPPKVTRLVQALWAAGAAGLFYTLSCLLAVVAVPWYLRGGGLVASAVFSLLLSAAVIGTAIPLFKGGFARMGLPDRRLVVFIVLGVAGLATVTTALLTSGPAWFVLLALLGLLLEAAAIGFALYGLFQPEVVFWLNAQPGAPAPAPPHQAPPGGYHTGPPPQPGQQHPGAAAPEPELPPQWQDPHSPYGPGEPPARP